jgi:hypothetical protein
VIRIVQTDCWLNTYDWKQELFLNICVLLAEGLAGAPTRVIYMCKNGEYAGHEADMAAGVECIDSRVEELNDDDSETTD